MQMGALRNNFRPDDAIVLGIDAGIDLFIYTNREHPDPQMPGRFHRVVMNAIDRGFLPWERIEKSLKRIAAIKHSLKFS
jgi:beta-glucosidase-like glycosyl hydrolase